MDKKMSKSQIKLIAHRGLHKNKEIPENSLLAFKKAIEKNYSIELDINITKDEQIVEFYENKKLIPACGFNTLELSNALDDMFAYEFAISL